jgi:Domain of unknown function (DUF6896)
VKKVNLRLAKDELLEAIAYFIERQKLVAQALINFGLDLQAMSILGAGGWTLGAEGAKQIIDVTSNNHGSHINNALKKMVENNTPRINQKGSWQDEDGETWDYYLHGGGCRLTHTITSEIIDWDCPSVLHFDAFKFGYHLEWQIEKFPYKLSNLVTYIRENELSSIEQKLIPELLNEGKLVKDLPNLYRVA